MTPSVEMADRRGPGYEVSKISMTEASVITARTIFAPESPWFDGHFPDNPIVPGIAQMSMIFDLMQRTMGPGVKLEGFKRVRFKQLIRPDTPISVLIKPAKKTLNRFEYQLTVDQKIVCTGFIDIRIDQTVRPPEQGNLM
ncbi:hydroxymyristoyl-ACP dehydratase [Desulfobacter postgatei]|uniref:ApeI family dehydratase n=1 Tax=Desulfobacter postgatei TaxID=2293 RepID=UPI00259BF2E6|nr:hydroxymyristoyl-ACP dehydratase [uncultured Desulfobacter sp.]